MRLYYMTQLETFEKYILPEQQIRISTFDRVNDPFELLGQIKNGNRQKHDFAWLRKYWTEAFGFISFSDNWRSPLMWAHYASNHTGVCLGIDVRIEEPQQIQYLSARSITDIDFTDFETAADVELFKRIATTKFEQWAYEREWRLFRKLDFDTQSPRPDFFYEQFSPDFELREVILGARCARTRHEMQKLLFATTESIGIKKARPAFRSFDMIEHYPNQRVTVHPTSDFNRSERNQLQAERYARAYAKDRAERKASRSQQT